MAVRRVALKKLVDRPRKFLDTVESEEKGELVMDGVAFEFNYLVFTSSKDATLSIQVMRWDDEKLDTYLVKRISAAEVKLK